ncbi:hypothetical protein V5799_027347 [Amblyomma americanum]|uniref:Uncharacterized protein n=1 Tax=Amblyomma americanum TaxID=6943 RepID=A0AAQ4DFZ9_AMBAM
MVNHGNVDGREGPLDDLEGFEPDIEEFEIPGEAYEDLESSDDSDERDAIRRFRFVKRFAAVPSVNFALFAASHLYSAFKEDYSTAGKVLDMVERCASLAYANLGQPVVDRLSTPLLVADLLACTALKKLELCCPEISKRPHEIIADVREFGQRKYDAIHAYVGEKVEAGRDFSECIATAAAHPVATARDCLRLAGDFAERQLGEAEAICEEVRMCELFCHY